jgi:hypothetical protein
VPRFYSRRVCREYLPSATHGPAASSGLRRQSARARWRFNSYIVSSPIAQSVRTCYRIDISTSPRMRCGLAETCNRREFSASITSAEGSDRRGLALCRAPALRRLAGGTHLIILAASRMGSVTTLPGPGEHGYSDPEKRAPVNCRRNLDVWWIRPVICARRPHHHLSRSYWAKA